MAEQDDDRPLLQELRSLRRRVALLNVVATLSLLLGGLAITLSLRSREAHEAPPGPRTVIADRVLTKELHVVRDPDTLAMDLQRPATPMVRRLGRPGGSVGVRPGEIHLIGGGEQEVMILSPGSITLIAGSGRVMEMSPDTSRMGIQLFAPEGWHSWPVDTLRPRRWVASRGK